MKQWYLKKVHALLLFSYPLSFVKVWGNFQVVFQDAPRSLWQFLAIGPVI